MAKTALAAATCLLMTTTALAAPNEIGFACKLYVEATKRPGNVVMSPTSIRLALGLAYAGAHGETATQMRTVLGLPEGNAAHEAVLAQMKRWDSLAHPAPSPDASNDPRMQKFYEDDLARRTTKLELANRLWVQKGQALRADYLALVQRDYRADTVPLDFQHATEPSRADINKWVSDKTDHHIKQLIPAGGVTPDTRAVLTNTVYFKASWDEAFVEMNTKSGPFFVSATKSVNVPLMRHAAHFANASTSDADVVELDYADGKMSMVLVIPRQKDGLPTVEKKLAELPQWLGLLSGTGLIDLTMPKFSMAAPLELADALQHLGMKLAFTFPGADFSGIDGSKLLYISRVIHQATIDVDEHGTVATAATALSMRAGGAPQQPKAIRADRPFLFLIRDKETNAILFMGRLVDPTAK